MAFWDDYQQRRDCKSRWSAMLPVLHRWTRPFSLIDVGANAGWFALRVKEMGSYPVCVEKEPVCAAALQGTGIPVIQSRVTGDQLLELAQSSHFDVVLALSILHHVEDWAPFLRGLLRLGEHVILEYPLESDVDAKNQHLIAPQRAAVESLPHLWLGDVSSVEGRPACRRMVLVTQRKTCVLNGAFYPRLPDRFYPFKEKHVSATYRDKTIDGQNWTHGIDLWSFLELGGTYPTREHIASLVQLPAAPHGDIRPWNYVLNHEGIHLIDWRGRRWHDDAESVQRTRDLILRGWHDLRA